jgi:hypothetical protein
MEIRKDMVDKSFYFTIRPIFFDKNTSASLDLLFSFIDEVESKIQGIVKYKELLNVYFRWADTKSYETSSVISADINIRLIYYAIINDMGARRYIKDDSTNETFTYDLENDRDVVKQITEILESTYRDYLTKMDNKIQNSEDVLNEEKSIITKIVKDKEL